MTAVDGVQPDTAENIREIANFEPELESALPQAEVVVIQTEVNTEAERLE